MGDPPLSRNGYLLACLVVAVLIGVALPMGWHRFLMPAAFFCMMAAWAFRHHRPRVTLALLQAGGLATILLAFVGNTP